jgi:hypothetical protein
MGFTLLLFVLVQSFLLLLFPSLLKPNNNYTESLQAEEFAKFIGQNAELVWIQV